MNDKKITIIATFKAKEGMEGELREELLKLIEPSRSDEGCIDYHLHQGSDDPTIFIFYENWLNREFLERHSATPHVRQFRAKAAGLLEKPAEIVALHRISG